jgi:hypothetical protein
MAKLLFKIRTELFILLSSLDSSLTFLTIFEVYDCKINATKIIKNSIRDNPDNNFAFKLSFGYSL